MILRKTVRALLVINALQFFAVILLATVLADEIGRQVNRTVFFAAAGLTGALLVSSLLTLYALYVSSRNQEKSFSFLFKWRTMLYETRCKGVVLQ